MWVNGIFEASGLLETSVQDKKNINTKVFIKENDKWKKKKYINVDLFKNNFEW